MKFLIAGTILLVALGACQTVAPVKQTTSGRPEATFHGETVAELTSRISRHCLERGMLVSQGQNQLTCSQQLSGGDAILATMAIGNSYSTTPQRHIRFNLLKQANGVRVFAQQWIETQMAFGQMRRQELNSGKQFNDVQNFLTYLGGV